MRYHSVILLALLVAGVPRVAASTPVEHVTHLSPTDSTAGPFAVHVKVTPGDQRVPTVFIIEASSDSTTLSQARGRLEAGDGPSANAVWCRLSPDPWTEKPNTIRFVIGLRRDLAEVGTFYLSISDPANSPHVVGGNTQSWEFNLASYLRK